MLDDELRVLVSVEPSPEFQARVRTRVSREPIGRGWLALPIWAFALAAATATAGVVYLVLIGSPGSPASPPALSSEQRAVFVAVSQSAVDERPVVVREEAAARPSRGTRVSPVHLDQAESRALRRLFTVPVRVVIVDGVKPTDDLELTIPAITIAPLVAETRSEGDRQ